MIIGCLEMRERKQFRKDFQCLVYVTDKRQINWHRDCKRGASLVAKGDELSFVLVEFNIQLEFSRQA